MGKIEDVNITQTLNERGKRYGEFSDHAKLSQNIKREVMRGQSFRDCTPAQKEALEMICHKLARIVNGDPNYDDSWRDIAGYSTLIVQEINKD